MDEVVKWGTFALQHDGKYPAHQLDDSDLEKFDGVNLQGHAQEPPEEREDTLALYIIDADKHLSKRFTVTKSVDSLYTRKTKRLIYGTSDDEGYQVKMILQWEKEIRVSPNTFPTDGERRAAHRR